MYQLGVYGSEAFPKALDEALRSVLTFLKLQDALGVDLNDGNEVLVLIDDSALSVSPRCEISP